ncbi:MAG: hypothetical protein NTZ29_01655, partial [Verrucomicrobia bacterium]|nr:hypothetical protein [Verrucomicrobiota bacterium]
MDTINGIHSSLNFAGTGNVVGEAFATRNTLHMPTGRKIGGQVAAVNAEVYADGVAPDSDNVSCIRANIGGDATGAGVLDGKTALIAID